MAKVWLGLYGLPMSRGVLLAERPFSELAKQLRLNKRQYLGGINAKVQMGKPTDAAAFTHRGYTHIVVLVVEPEATTSGWKAGYYHVPFTAKETAERLGVRLPEPPPPHAQPEGWTPDAAPGSTAAPAPAPTSAPAPAPTSEPTEPPTPTKITI